MTFVPADAGEYTSRVVENIHLSRRYFLLRIERPPLMGEPGAGSFLHVAVPASGRFYLRRPFSIHDCSDNTIELLVVEAGAGTRRMRSLASGDQISFYGPLGRGFPVLPGRRIMAVGGGVGLAPLYFYAFRALSGPGPDYRLLYGARTAEDLFLDHMNLERGGVVLATDDGSHGFRGNVVELMASELERDRADVIFSCGPTVMMKAVQKLAQEKGIEHFVALENRMACGLGACRACVVPTTSDSGFRYRTVCHDGPVFNASELVWNELPSP